MVPTKVNGEKRKMAEINHQNNVLTSRSIGTVYQNTTRKALFVNVAANGGTNNLDAQSDGVTPPTEFVASSAPSNAQNVTISFIVLPGNYYLISHNGTPSLWVEWA